MYNFKKIFRRKTNYVLIIIFSALFLSLIFLFKYIFIVEKDIEVKIYDNYKNREIIVFDDSPELIKKLKDIDHILYIYCDYQMLELNNEDISINLRPMLKKDMPSLIEGHYPTSSNEIILPKFIIVNNQKTDLSKYINKKISFTLNNELEMDFKITGIYEVEDELNAYLNIEQLENILTTNNKTEYSRILIDHYKNLDIVLKEIDNNSSLYDTSGLIEIKTYKSLFNLVLLLTTIIFIFMMVVSLITSLILCNDSKEERFINYAIGYNEKEITMNYLNYYLKLIIISFLISILFYLISIFLYKRFIFAKNLILNDLFRTIPNLSLIIPIICVFLLLLLINYIVVRFSKRSFHV